MTHLPFWLGGIALAAVAFGHWLLLRRSMAVSGRITSLVNRVRHGPEPEPGMSVEELMAAAAAATQAQFGEVPPAPAPAVTTSAPARAPAPAHQGTLTHVIWFVAVTTGGALSMLLSGGWSAEGLLRGQTFSALFQGPLGAAALFVGGTLVGFGTRMAGGCTSGHGLGGVSRLQPGSLAATAAFFGMGVVTSFLLGRLL
ncbi:MAG: hypothetical protein AB2A00_13415 [Myxococcota bacterium]